MDRKILQVKSILGVSMPNRGFSVIFRILGIRKRFFKVLQEEKKTLKIEWWPTSGG